MKRSIILILILAVLVSLTACGQSDAAKAADEAINAIGEVTLDSKKAINKAETIVDSLKSEDLEQVRGIEKLNEAKDKYAAIVLEDAIEKIGTVTIDNGDKVLDALNAYDELSDNAKKMVSNYDKLLEAEKKLDDILAETLIEKIDAIGTVDINSESMIADAEEIYSVLGDEAKKKVTNYSKLTAARAEYAKVAEKEYKNAFSRMVKHEDTVANYTFYIHNHMPKYNNERCSLLPYIGIKNGSKAPELRLVTNYAGDEWVFFKKLIVAVDDKRYTITFNYSDITHGNAGRMVGEYHDEYIGENKERITMLREIASSKKTIVRFQGDDYSHDYTLSSADKSAIRDVLIVYDHMVKNA